jgi:hypothetical protein
MARPRKPTAVLELTGAFRKDPQRKKARASEPVPTGVIGIPPVHFDAIHAAVWYEVISMIPAGVLTGADRIMVELTCSLICGLRNGTSERGDKALLKGCLASMGMTPAERSKISVPKKPEEVDDIGALAAEIRNSVRPN